MNLEFVEHLVRVLVNNATLTCWAEREAVETTKQRISSATVLTGGGFSPQAQRFVFDILVCIFVSVLEPLFEV